MGLCLVALLGACSAPPRPAAPVVSAPAPVAAPVVAAAPAPAPIPVRAANGLPPPRPVRNAQELRRQAAERLVAANPAGSYMSRPPEILLAIPILEVELKADGSVRKVNVVRQPGQAIDTVQLAIDAVHRAAPFGDVRHMPEPWKFTETFLFDDQRRFKPRSLD
jgi:hypothetical protein